MQRNGKTPAIYINITEVELGVCVYVYVCQKINILT